jgi:AhpD family alkylhydroperoxidase
MKSKKIKGRKLYSIIESYNIEVNAIRMFSVVKEALKSEMISEQFKERIMLAVTNVNGCSLCSYAHTKYALESGMSDIEIKKLLSSDPDLENTIPQEEAAAITFAQHYADTRCKPDKKAWQNIVERYGDKKALAILGLIRIITMGNALGARLSGIIDRIKHQKYDERTTVLSSVLYFIGSIITLPFVLIQALIMKLFKVQYI